MQLFQRIKCIGVFKSLGLLLFFVVVFRQQSSLVSLTIFKFNFIPFLFNLRYNQLVQTLVIKENLQLTEISSHKVKLSPNVSFHDFRVMQLLLRRLTTWVSCPVVMYSQEIIMENASSATFLFLPHFDVIRDPYLTNAR